MTIMTLSTIVNARAEFTALAWNCKLLLFWTIKARTSFFRVNPSALHLTVPALTVHTLAGGHSLSVVVHNTLQ